MEAKIKFCKNEETSLKENALVVDDYGGYKNKHASRNATPNVGNDS